MALLSGYNLVALPPARIIPFMANYTLHITNCFFPPTKLLIIFHIYNRPAKNAAYAAIVSWHGNTIARFCPKSSIISTFPLTSRWFPADLTPTTTLFLRLIHGRYTVDTRLINGSFSNSCNTLTIVWQGVYPAVVANSFCAPDTAKSTGNHGHTLVYVFSVLSNPDLCISRAHIILYFVR